MTSTTLSSWFMVDAPGNMGLPPRSSPSMHPVSPMTASVFAVHFGLTKTMHFGGGNCQLAHMALFPVFCKCKQGQWVRSHLGYQRMSWHTSFVRHSSVAAALQPMYMLFCVLQASQAYCIMFAQLSLYCPPEQSRHEQDTMQSGCLIDRPSQLHGHVRWLYMVHMLTT